MKDLIIEDFPMSEIEFEKRFNTEQACMDYLAKMKWPEGFCCQRCGHWQYWISAKRLYICTRCESGYSLTAGTVMHGTKKPLTYWFKAMWWFTTRKSGVNAVNLKELLGLGSYQTAWAWLHKLRRCTIRQVISDIYNSRTTTIKNPEIENLKKLVKPSKLRTKRSGLNGNGPASEEVIQIGTDTKQFRDCSGQGGNG